MTHGFTRTALQFGVLTLAFSPTLGCGSNRSDIPGELGRATSDVSLMAPRGDVLYYTSGATVYSFDVSDPRQPRRTDSDAWGALSCGTTASITCRGFEVDGSTAYQLDSDELSRVQLPDAIGPLWIQVVATGDHYCQSLELLPGGNLAISRDLDDVPGGDILLFDMASGAPSLAATILEPVAHGSYALVQQGSFLYSATGSGSLPQDYEIAIYDVTDIYAPGQVARFALSVPPENAVVDIAIRGSDVLIYAVPVPYTDAKSWLAWYRLSLDLQSLTLMGEYDEAILTVDEGAALLDGYAITAAANEGPEAADTPTSTIVYRLDETLGIVEHTRTPGIGYIRHIAVDEERGLVFAGGSDFQILDLGFITTGEPSWP